MDTGTLVVLRLRAFVAFVGLHRLETLLAESGMGMG